MIGLKRGDRGAQLAPQGLQARIDLREGDRTVLLRIALAEHIVIDAMQHEDVHVPISRMPLSGEGTLQS